VLEDVASPDQSWMLGLWQKPSWILDVLGDVSGGATKEAKFCCQDRLSSPGELAFLLSSFEEGLG